MDWLAFREVTIGIYDTEMIDLQASKRLFTEARCISTSYIVLGIHFAKEMHNRGLSILVQPANLQPAVSVNRSRSRWAEFSQFCETQPRLSSQQHLS